MFISPRKDGFLVLLALLLALCLHTIDAAYRIGLGKGDITGPAAEVVMMGYVDSNQKSAGILNRLYARAFIIEDADTTQRVVFVNSDLQAVFQLVHQEVMKQLGNKYYGLYTEQSVVSHNSVAPGTIRFNNGAVANGGKNRSPLAYAANPEEERKQYEFNHDTDLCSLQFRDAKDNLRGVLGFFPVHPTSLTQHNKLVSGDNKGYAEFLLEDTTAVENAEIICKRQSDKVFELLNSQSELVVGLVLGWLAVHHGWTPYVKSVLKRVGVIEVEVAFICDACAQYLTTKEEYLRRPTPRQFDRSKLMSVQKGIVVDTAPLGKRFDALRSDAHASCAITPTASATLYSAHPKSRLSAVTSFCDVEQEVNGKFVTLLTDAHWDVRLHCHRHGISESRSVCGSIDHASGGE